MNKKRSPCTCLSFAIVRYGFFFEKKKTTTIQQSTFFFFSVISFFSNFFQIYLLVRRVTEGRD